MLIIFKLKQPDGSFELVKKDQLFLTARNFTEYNPFLKSDRCFPIFVAMAGVLFTLDELGSPVSTTPTVIAEYVVFEGVPDRTCFGLDELTMEEV